MNITREMLSLPNQVELELLTNDNTFLGFGEIRIAGLTVRSGRVPLQVELSTPLGVRYTHFTLDAIESAPEGLRVRLFAHGRQELVSDVCDDYEADLLLPSLALGEEIIDRLSWIFTPCRQAIDGVVFSGFSYAVEFSSDARCIYRLRFLTTFELGGNIDGVTILHQGQCVPPAFTVTGDSFYTSSVLKSIGAPGSGEAGFFNQSMQLNSRHGTIQSFDYQYSPDGVLIGRWERGEYVRSLIQKNAGENVLFIIDEHHVPYGTQARTCAKEILFAPIANPLRARDLWKITKDQVLRGFQEQWGFHGMPLRTEDGINESWVGLLPGGECWFKGRIVPPERLLYVLADEWLPQIKEHGMELVGFNMFQQSDVSEYGRRCKLDEGVHGDLMVSSICNTWRYYPSQYWGGMEAWKYYAARAHEAGLQVGTWIGNQMSRNAPILREHPEWFNVGRTGKSNLGGYTSMLGSTVDWNSGFRQWIVDDLKRWRDEGGLDYIFIDSWGNLGLLPIHYSRNFTNNLDGIARLIAELQQAGFAYIQCEATGPFCVPRFGVGTHQTQAEGQNSIYWWRGNEDLADGLNLHMRPMSEMNEADSHAFHFRFLANNALFNLQVWQEETPAALADKERLVPVWEGTSGLQEPAYRYPLLSIWPQVRDYMYGQRRTTLPDNRGVLWSGGTRQVLWSYRPFPYHAGGKIEQIYPIRRNINGADFMTEALAVYLI